MLFRDRKINMQMMQRSINDSRFKILTAVLLKIPTVCDVMPCCLAHIS